MIQRKDWLIVRSDTDLRSKWAEAINRVPLRGIASSLLHRKLWRDLSNKDKFSSHEKAQKSQKKTKAPAIVTPVFFVFICASWWQARIDCIERCNAM